MNDILHLYLTQYKQGCPGETFDSVGKSAGLGDIFDDFKGDLALSRGLWEFFVEIVCFGLGADGTADRVAFFEELGEDVGAYEAAWAGDEDEGCHL